MTLNANLHAELRSSFDLEPLEKGGEVGRHGFLYQDHVGAGFCLDMIELNLVGEMLLESFIKGISTKHRVRWTIERVLITENQLPGYFLPRSQSMSSELELVRNQSAMYKCGVRGLWKQPNADVDSENAL